MRNCEKGKTRHRGERTPFLKFYTDDWAGGTRSLTIEQKGFYFECLVRMWERKGPLPNDVAWVARAIQCDPRQARRLLAALIEEGKLEIDGEHITNTRMMRDISGRSKPDLSPISAEDQPKIAAKKSKTSTKTTEVVQNENAPYSIFHIPEPEEEKKTPLPPKGAGATPTDALKAFETYNATALRCGLPQAAKLTPDRQRKIIARLKDYGLDGWAQALGNIEKSSFLTGGSTNGFRADLDFMLQAKSFGKLHDGGYGNGRHTVTTQLTPEQQVLKARYDAIMADGVPS